MKRIAQHDDESTVEFLRRAVFNLGYERESLLDALTTVEAVLDFFDLWKIYGTDLLDGIHEAIRFYEADPKPLRDFIKKHKLDWEVPARVEREGTEIE